MADNRKRYSSKQMEMFKTSEIINMQMFRRMDKKQAAELLMHYEKQFTTSELAELWDVKTTAISNVRYELKKGGYYTGSLRGRKRSIDKTPKETNEIAVTPVEEIAPAVEAKTSAIPMEFFEQMMGSNPQAVQVMKPSGDDLHVSLEEFMKMLEIQEKMARMMEEQQKQKNVDGFQFQFKGEFTSQELEKRLKKVLAIIEEEPYKYAVRFELIELEKEEDKGIILAHEDAHNELLQEVNTLQESMKEMQSQLEGQKKTEQDKQLSYQQGYIALASDKNGLHHPRSEYEKAGDTKGVVHKNGKTLYQTFYICSCGHKGKHFLENGTVYANCTECGKRMRIRPAVKDELLKQDAYGNFFVAGKFKRVDEIQKEKPLYEAFGVHV